ncbi:hypothetical protein HMI55_003623 [Coelomomyces lativittatus]|nr:hypothetical protein HMI55_003623 [Coelomomyces lativittatus]
MNTTCIFQFNFYLSIYFQCLSRSIKQFNINLSIYLNFFIFILFLFYPLIRQQPTFFFFFKKTQILYTVSIYNIYIYVLSFFFFFFFLENKNTKRNSSNVLAIFIFIFLFLLIQSYTEIYTYTYMPFLTSRWKDDLRSVVFILLRGIPFNRSFNV